jgi:SAM-dependent methyltransferase
MLFGSLGATMATIALAIALIGSAAGGIISSPRLILALAKDKLFVEQFSVIHPRRQTPYKAILFQTVISILIAILTFGDYRTALALLVPLALLMYVPVLLTVPILRWKYPHKARHPRILFGMIGPVLVSLVYLGMIVAWFLTGAGAHTIFYNVLILISFGIPIYLLLNVYYNPELLLTAMDSLAPLHWFFEGVLLPKRVRKEVVGLFKGLEGKNVLEFGSGVGAFTMHLAKLVGKDGNIYAVDYSPANIRILARRLKKSGHAQVHLIHDGHFISRVHPSVPHVDFVYSIGNLSYVQDVKRVLSDMHAILPENGRICFVEYVDYFWGLIPNPPWLDRHEHIESLFHGLGFSVRVKRSRGLFWNHLYIYGIKSDRDVPVI